MSKKSEARRSVVAANNHLGGAFCTKKQRRSHGNNFIDWCYKNAMPLMSIKEATFEPIKAYLAARGLPPDSQENRTEFESEFFKLHNKKPCSIATIHNILASRSGPVCLNNFPRFISGLRVGCQRCRVIHGGVRLLRRTHSRGGQLGAHPICHFMQPQPVRAASSGKPARA